MMQLLCNGYRLDLYDSAEVQFTHDNPLFAFDDLKCERTTQFKLPCTPTNDAAFSLARIPAYDGTGMRRKFSAQMQIGTIVKSGYLYVASFDGKDYNAVFVCGELVGLQNIKNAGSIRDIMASVLGITYGRYELQSILQPVNSTSIEQNFAQINYRRDAAFAHPSADLYWLISSALTHLGQNYDMPRKHYRVIAKDLVHFLQKPLEVIVNNGVTMQIPSGVIGAYFIQEGRTFLRRAWTYQIDPHTQEPVTIDTEDTTTNVSCLVCDVDIELSFPSDFPDYMVVTPNGTMSADFLSDRRVDVDLQSGHAVVSGDKLAGGSVAIPAFTPFFLVRTDEFDYHEEQPQPYPDTWQRVWGWRINTSTRDLNIYAQSSSTPQVGDYIVIADNLPDVSVVELCKTYAALTGTILNYSDADGLTFDELKVENWARLHVSRVMKRGEVKRTFSNYAQRNTMQFDSGDGVYPYERVSNAYTIDNANIEEEKELVTIPFSEGGGVGNEVYVRDTNSEDVVASAEIPEGVVWQYMHKCELPLNENMQALCDASTQVQIESRMTAEEYNIIQPNSKLIIEGGAYLWTNRQWQKDVAKMTLARISNAQIGSTMPKPNEVWVWPLTQTPDAGMVQNATLISTGEINGIKICQYDAPVLTAGRLILTTENTPSIIVFPEGFQKQNISQYWVFNQYITDLYLPSTFQYLGQRNFRAGIGGYIHNVWLAWNEPQQYIEIGTGYDRVVAYHVRAGLKAAYVAAGWPADRIEENYEFNPWARITRGVLTEENER